MSTGAKPEPGTMVGRLALTIAGMVLMVAPPFVFDLLKLSSRFQNAIIAGIELLALVVGFVLLYLGVKEPRPSERRS
jgi:hypothetical protein